MKNTQRVLFVFFCDSTNSITGSAESFVSSPLFLSHIISLFSNFSNQIKLNFKVSDSIEALCPKLKLACLQSK